MLLIEGCAPTCLFRSKLEAIIAYCSLSEGHLACLLTIAKPGQHLLSQ